MYALVDNNNFYVSCERAFNPKLEGRPVIVLSNNDGCAIARSEEAKAIGIQMGAAVHLIENLIRQHQVVIFSSNYTLYGDMSDRVMKTLAGFVPRLEVYSIDEAFLDMSDLKYQDLFTLGVAMRTKVKKDLGLPVSVGIAPTKTLAKMANRYAKKVYRERGVYCADNQASINEMLQYTEVGDIWGVGRQYATMLRKNGFNTAFDLTSAPEEWMRKNMTVVGQRLVKELKGSPAIDWKFEAKAKKNICTSRSFGILLTEKSLIREAVAEHAAACAAKLRREKNCAAVINVFIHTNPFRKQDCQYSGSVSVKLEVASNETPVIIKNAMKALDLIFQEGHNYVKAGVIAFNLVPEDQVQFGLFTPVTNKKTETAVKTMDKLNQSLGRDVIRFAAQGYAKRHKLRAAHLSKHYTTNISQLVKIKL